MSQDGWSKGTFRVAFFTSPDRMRQPPEWRDVSGVVNGSFGIWWHSAECRDGSVVVYPLMHIPSGFGLAVFLTREDAEFAAGIAERLADWNSLTVDDVNRVEDRGKWFEVRDRMFRAWDAAGVKPAATLDGSNAIVWRRVGIVPQGHA